MNPQITKRREFLAQYKNSSKSTTVRLTIAFTGIADFRSFIGQEYISGIVKACEDYDINFINMCEAVKYSFFDDIDFLTHYSKKFRFMRPPLVDGLVTWASSLVPYLPNEQIIKKFRALSPIPMIDIGYLDIPDVSALRIDNSCSMKLIIEHLVKIHGYKKFAFFGCEFSRPHTERLDSFKQVLTSLNFDSENVPIFMARSLNEADIVRTVEEIYDSFFKHKSEFSKIDAIVTSSDIIASILISELEKRGISVPENLAVTGFNNQYQGITSSPPITTINLEYFKRAYMAVEFLIDQIMNPEQKAQTITVPTSLVIRESCGCFEKQIIEAGAKIKNHTLNSDANEDEGRNFLFEQVNQIFPRETHESKMNLVNAVFSDLYEKQNPPKILKWFAHFLKNERSIQFRSAACQEKITKFRLCLLELCGADQSQKAHIENITNQLRVLCSVTSDYENMVGRDSSYLFNNITQAAIHFASASSGKEMQTALRTHLAEFGIPGIVLSLSDNMTTDLETTSVELVIPELAETEQEKIPYKLSDVSRFPKSFFPKNARYSMVLEILHYNDRYFGFAFMQMYSKNMALYDSVRLLLSHSLYSLYLREGRTKEHSMLLNTEQLKGILQIDEQTNPLENSGKLTVQQITSYLIEHIGERTSLDKMASELGLSKSKLIRQTKALTGYSVQSLHETLKMKMAKTMLLEGRLKLAEIAERLGFQNGNYFSNVFKKNFGESPRSWAKSQKEKRK